MERNRLMLKRWKEIGLPVPLSIVFGIKMMGNLGMPRRPGSSVTQKYASFQDMLIPWCCAFEHKKKQDKYKASFEDFRTCTLPCFAASVLSGFCCHLAFLVSSPSPLFCSHHSIDHSGPSFRSDPSCCQMIFLYSVTHTHSCSNQWFE